MSAWVASGEQLGLVYHGGRRKVTSIDPGELQQRDPGFYGRGFYVTTTPHYAKTYGPKVSVFRFVPGSRILLSSLKSEEAPEGLVQEVLAHLYNRDIEKARARGKEAAFQEWLETIPANPLDWKNAVDAYGEDKGFDAIAHSKGEIVVKNPKSLESA